MNPVFLVFARDKEGVREKIDELSSYGYPVKVICGEEMSSESEDVYYREARGKWDAINYSKNLLRKEYDPVILNDVDTEIHNLGFALEKIRQGMDLVYCKVRVKEGPQVRFYKLMDTIRRFLHIAASGELMVLRRRVFMEVLPIPPCLAEDSYILFKALEKGFDADFTTKTYVRTERTSNPEEEISYKKRTTMGIYQALEHSHPPLLIRAFYRLLPILAPLLKLEGENGDAWAEGIKKGYNQVGSDENPKRF